MKIYRYWAKVSQSTHDTNDKAYNLVSWAGSNESKSNAEWKAQSKLTQLLEKLQFGETLTDYEYGRGDLREEVVREIHDSNGELIAAITRNRYGALVLNCATLFIGDIDVKPSSFMQRVMAIFGRKSANKNSHLQHINTYHQQNPHLNIRVYETNAGLRLFITNKTFDPTSETTQQLFSRLGCDKLYARLCYNQACFRARLTPKPWRIRAKRPPNRFPRESTLAKEHFAAWLTDYQDKTQNYAVCRLLQEWGSSSTAYDTERLLRLHDKHVLGYGNEPLA